MVLEFLKFINVFSLFCYYLPYAIIWTILNSIHQRMLCPKVSLNLPRGSGEERFLNFINVLEKKIFMFHQCIFATLLSSPWKEARLFNWTYWDRLNPRFICTKLGWKWLSGSGDNFSFNFVNLISNRPHCSPEKKLA